MKETRESLEREFFTRIPKARKSNPMWRAIFHLMYKAHQAARPGKKLLNIYSSWDLSGNREGVYQEKFFNECDYETIDYKEDGFVDEKNPHKKNRHLLPFPDAHFDIVVTTKYIMEHISEPETVVREIRRVLKPGGQAFLVAAHVRRQHQAPYDFFRYTEYGLRHLFQKAGFSSVEITPSNGCMVTLAEYAYFLQRGLNIPKWLERTMDKADYWIIQPVAFFLDRFDNGYGRDMALYFLVHAKVE